jgi:hypothetical protein
VQKELYNSVDGATVGNRELDEASSRIESLSQKLQYELKKQDQGCHMWDGDQALHNICDGCIAVSTELSGGLEELKISAGNNKKWDSFRKGLKSVWSKGKIEEIVIRLDGFRQELNTHILVELRYLT